MDVMQINYSAQSAHSLLPSNWPGHYLMSPSIKPADAFVRTFARLPCRLQMSMLDAVVRLFVHNVPIQDPSSPQRIRFSALGPLLARGPHGQRTSAGGTEAALIKVGHPPSAKRRGLRCVNNTQEELPRFSGGNVHRSRLVCGAALIAAIRLRGHISASRPPISRRAQAYACVRGQHDPKQPAAV